MYYYINIYYINIYYINVVQYCYLTPIYNLREILFN